MADVDWHGFLAGFAPEYRVLAVKSYRVDLGAALRVPLLPCLDHEATLHASSDAHVSAYVQGVDDGGGIHEVALHGARRLVLDEVSTAGEHSPVAAERLRSHLARRHPGLAIHVHRASRLRGDPRAIEASRAQVTLREVLTGEDLAHTEAQIRRLDAVASIIEKESRVASWGVRTATTPLLAVAGVLAYLLVEAFAHTLSSGATTTLRYAIVTAIGAVLLYLGLKAVQLTGISSRVSKRSTEYGLVLEERRRLAVRGPAATS